MDLIIAGPQKRARRVHRHIAEPHMQEFGRGRECVDHVHIARALQMRKDAAMVAQQHVDVVKWWRPVAVYVPL